MDFGSELAMQIRNIAAEVMNNTSANRVAILEGRIAGYNQSNGTIQVTLAHYYTPDQTPFIVSVPYGLFMAGNGYGDYFYAEENQACILVSFADGGAGDWVQAFLLHDPLNPPASFSGSGIAGALQPGDRAIVGKGGWLFRMGSGKIQLGSAGAGGTTPAAVEGSTVTHYHQLNVFFAALASEITAYITANPPSAASMGATDLAAIFATLATTLSTALQGTDIAGTAGTTTSAVDTGAGAQSVLLPAPGQS